MNWAAFNLAGTKELQGSIENKRFLSVEGSRSEEVILGKKADLLRLLSFRRWQRAIR